jgi:hypothetical protein
MRVNKKLNLVFPLVTDDERKMYVHSAPISRDVFEQFYSELGGVFTKCFEGMNEAHLALAAPQLAYPALKSMARKAGTWEDVRTGLVNEIIRLTNIVTAGNAGWETIPMDAAIKQETISEDDAGRVLSDLVFFTSISLVAPLQFKEAFLQAAGSLRDWDFISSNSTEYMNGLPTLTVKESTKKKISSPIS